MIKKLSIIIPVLNEEATLEKVLAQVIKAPVLNYEKEIIIVDDGSTDRTAEILDNIKLHDQGFQIKILRHEKNQGKGKAIKTGLKAATGNALIIQDADLEYSPNDYQNLLNSFNKGNPVVYGSRNINPKRKGYTHYVLGVWFLTMANNLLFSSKLTDIYTCYKLFSMDLIKSIPFKSKGFEFEAEITAKILKKGFNIKEVPIGYNPRKFKEGKKIRFKDGLLGLWTIFKYRFTD